MKHHFTKEQGEYLANNIKGRSQVEVVEMFNDYFGLGLGINQIRAYLKNHKLRSGLDCRFKKGQKVWNKGMKGLQIGGKETQFKKRQMPINYRPVGSERINVDGYIEIKVEDPRKWRSKHVVVWEEANRPVKKGDLIIFGDGDKTNLDIDNLILVSRRQLAIINKNHLIQDNAELTRTGVMVADLYLKMSERKRG